MTRRSGHHPSHRTVGKWRILLLLSVLCIGGVAYSFYGHGDNRPSSADWVLKSSTPAKEASAQVVREPNRNLPAKIIIPRLKIDAPVIYLGLAKSGAMDSPKNIAETGWYKNGALPGNEGTAVIAGHVNGPAGQPGVFAGLQKLKAGDTVTVTDLNGLSTKFIVRTQKIYNQDDRPEEVFHSSDGAHLNLITCTGDWNNSDREYSQRLVVFTDKE